MRIARNLKGALVFLVSGLMALPAVAENYQNAVKRLQPTYYYELNETDPVGGAIDSMGNAPANGTFNGNYVNGPAMVGAPGPSAVFSADDPAGIPVLGLGEGNVAHHSNNAGHITLGDGNAFGANAMTVALFVKAGEGAQGGDRLFTNNLTDPTKSFQLNIGNNGPVLAVDPSQAGINAERTLYQEDNSGPDRRFLQANSGWFHVVVSTEGQTGTERASNFRMWVNGVDRTSNLHPDSTGWGTDTGMAKIGGRRFSATDTTTHSGGQDEVAIWLDRVLTDEEILSLWQAVITAKPQRVEVTEVSVEDGQFVIKWESRRGKLYNLLSASDPGASNPFDWPVFGANADVVATPPENTLAIPLPADQKRLFVIKGFNAPPVTVFSDDFENGQGDWTIGSVGNSTTNWELGSPSVVGPPAANSPANCFGTNISADYTGEADAWLRSPAIDLTQAGGATLSLFQFADIEQGFDEGAIKVLDAADDSILATVESPIDGLGESWTEFSKSLPAEALGRNIKIEFRFVSDDIENFAGWYIDNVVVTVDRKSVV